VEYRRLSPGDGILLTNMVWRFRREISAIERAEAFLADPRSYLLACLDGGEVIGFVLAHRLLRYDNRPDMLYIHELAVDAAHQQRGIGSALMQMVKQSCALEGLSYAFLITQSSNEAAVRLFQSTEGSTAHADDVVFFWNRFPE
jgi:ribosomal protein S18 acetylase RimI-like enzyme